MTAKRKKPRKPKVEPYKSYYVIACEAGRENWILDYLKRERKLRGLEKEIGQIIYPHTVIEELTDEGWKENRRPMFPGYMLIQMHFCEATFLLIEDAKKRSVFGLLPLRPSFYVKHPDPRKRPTKKLDLRKSEFQMLEDWLPHKCSTKEAAYVMLETKRTEAPPVTTDIKPGVRIVITNPKSSFVNQEGKVQQVLKQERGFQFVVEIKIADRPVQIRISHKDCEAVVKFEQRNPNQK